MSGGNLILQGIGLIIFALILSFGIPVGDYSLGLRGGTAMFFVLIVIGIVMVIYGAVKSAGDSSSPKEQKMLDELASIYLKKYGAVDAPIHLDEDISKLISEGLTEEVAIERLYNDLFGK